MGRSLGVSVVVNTQHPIGEHLGPFGSTIKSNFGARLVTGAIEAEGAAALFGKGNGEAIAEALRAGIPRSARPTRASQRRTGASGSWVRASTSTPTGSPRSPRRWPLTRPVIFDRPPASAGDFIDTTATEEARS